MAAPCVNKCWGQESTRHLSRNMPDGLTRGGGLLTPVHKEVCRLDNKENMWALQNFVRLQRKFLFLKNLRPSIIKPFCEEVRLQVGLR